MRNYAVVQSYTTIITNVLATDTDSLVFTCVVNIYWAGILGKPNSSTPMPSYINN